MLEIVYAENCEQFLWENSEQFSLMKKNRFFKFSRQIRIYNKHDGHSANFITVETDFIIAKKWARLLWNSNMKNHSDLLFRFRKIDFTRCFTRKQVTIF